jgi:hypothetical protein
LVLRNHRLQIHVAMHAEYDLALAEESLVEVKELRKVTTTWRVLSSPNAAPVNVPRHKRKAARISNLTDGKEAAPRPGCTMAGDMGASARGSSGEMKPCRTSR